MQLSKRLTAVAHMVTRGSRLADVGCDHGYIPIALVTEGHVQSAIAMDINQGPLERARQNIEQFAAAQYIETRLSDGVAALYPGEVDSVIIAGMGGNLMVRILEKGRDVFEKTREMILQPQSEIAFVRHYLANHGYQIVDEDMVFEDGKYYIIMKAIHGRMEYEKEIFFEYGRILLEKKHPVLREFLNVKLRTAEKICEKIASYGNEDSVERINEIKKEMQKINSALKYYDM